MEELRFAKRITSIHLLSLLCSNGIGHLILDLIFLSIKSLLDFP